MNQNPLELPWFQRAGFDVQEFSANGIRTFAVVEGRRDQFPVIFLHGFPGGAFLWEYVIAALGRKRLAIAPDFPGWGRSLSRFGAELPAPTPAWCMEWLNGMLAAQNIERFDIVAHGNGCWLALEQLLQDPSRVRRLALISPSFAPARLSPGSALGRLLGRRAKWTPKRIERWLESSAAFAPELRERSAKSFAHVVFEQQVPGALTQALYQARFADYRRALHEFRGRSLLMWGERDPSYFARVSEELEASLDRPEVHRCALSGHFPMLDEPQVVTQVLREFLED